MRRKAFFFFFFFFDRRLKASRARNEMQPTIFFFFLYLKPALKQNLDKCTVSDGIQPLHDLVIFKRLVDQEVQMWKELHDEIFFFFHFFFPSSKQHLVFLALAIEQKYNQSKT